MTQFIGVAEMTKLVRNIGIETFLTDLAGFISEDFLRWPDFDKMARIASHSPDGVIELMPASDDALYGFKYVNGHPNNPGAGKPTVMAFGVLADVASGTPLLITEMTLLTALRTAATSAMAARALARPNASVLALVGAGAQSEFQALAMRAIIGIDTVQVYDPDPAAIAKFERNMAGLDLRIIRAGSVREAVRGADIVTVATAVKGRAAVLTPDMLEPGMHINAIGGDCPGKTELHPDVLRLGTVFVEFPPQTRVEGDIQQMPADFPVTELWQVLSGTARGRLESDAITIFDSVGFAIEDFAALRYVRSLLAAGEHQIDLIPDIADPKDLFGELLGVARRRRPSLDRRLSQPLEQDRAGRLAGRRSRGILERNLVELPALRRRQGVCRQHDVHRLEEPAQRHGADLLVRLGPDLEDLALWHVDRLERNDVDAVIGERFDDSARPLVVADQHGHDDR